MTRNIYQAIVTNNTNEDLGDKLRGAVYFQCDNLLEDKEYPIPAIPLFPHNWFDVPEVGDTIEIEIDDFQTHDKPIPRWRALIITDDNDLPDEFKKNYTKRRGIKTHGGHLLLFDDKNGEKLIKLMHHIGTYFEMTDIGDLIENVVRHHIKTVGSVNRITSGQLHDIIAPRINLNGTGSGITTLNGHAGVIDLITGAPITPSPTTFGDI